MLTTALEPIQVDTEPGQGVSVKKYGSGNTKVCGDRLCSESESQESVSTTNADNNDDNDVNDNNKDKNNNTNDKNPQIQHETKSENKLKHQWPNAHPNVETTFNEEVVMPTIASEAFIHPFAVVIGNCHIGKMVFVAHRGWDPDGRTIYYIVTDATPSGPAGMMGVVNAPTSASLIANSAAVDLFQFKNGVTGSGPLGFQPGIAAGAPGDVNYSPMWRIFMIGWENESNASVLETISDINAYREAGLITSGLARPMDSDHIVNCPFIDPFQ